MCTEQWNTPLAGVSVFVKAGSRNETLETSGAAYFLERTNYLGTERRSRAELEAEVEGLGGQLNSKTGREVTSYNMQVFHNDVERAVDILGDMMTSNSLNENQLEAERDAISRTHENNHTEFRFTTLENAHFNAYREHMIGQPVRGDRDNAPHITLDHVRDFQRANYYGDNIVVVATGNVRHNDVVDMVERHFGRIGKQPPLDTVRQNSERPVYTPALMFVRDDEMYNANVAVFYDAPPQNHPDYYGFLLLQNVLGEYRVDKHAEHLNDVRKQYHALHSMLGDLPDVTQHSAHYFAYGDAGLYGNYFFGNEVFSRQMAYCGLAVHTIYGHYFTDVEVFRSRNKLYNKLLENETVGGVA